MIEVIDEAAICRNLEERMDKAAGSANTSPAKSVLLAKPSKKETELASELAAWKEWYANQGGNGDMMCQLRGDAADGMLDADEENRPACHLDRVIQVEITIVYGRGTRVRALQAEHQRLGLDVTAVNEPERRRPGVDHIHAARGGTRFTFPIPCQVVDDGIAGHLAVDIT